MKKSVLPFLLALFFVSAVTAQEFKELCGAEGMHNEQYANNGQYKEAYERTQAYLKKIGVANYKTVTTMSGTEYHVPIVVHVIHTGGALGSIYNPSDAQVNAFVARINNGFNNLLDHASVPGAYNSVSIPLRFYLAQRDEASSCAATTGINRINFSSNAAYVSNGVNRSATGGVSDGTIKALAHWNDLNYYNIYIINKIDNNDGTVGSYVAGYANYPTLGGSRTEGMVVLSTVSASTTSTTIIHELGHAFNLRHTFQGGGTSTCATNTSCATQGDLVCDTEPIYQSIACNPSGNNPCTSAPYNGTQFNYLTYTSCRDRFTAGQSTRMLSALNTIRTSYKNSAGIDPPPASLPISVAATTINPTHATGLTNMGPKSVSFNTIDNTSNGFSYEGAGFVPYVDNTCNQATTILVGAPHTLSVLTEGNNQKAVAYIDWDNNGVFGNTASELVLSSTGNSSPPQTHTVSITAPASAVYNTPLRMRVLTDFGTNPTITPTGQLNYGQAEDYTVTVLGAALPVAWRSISANLNSRNNIDVRWGTEMEHNSNLFEIEKSKDGINFYKIGSMKAVGNSDRPSYYNYEDKKNVNGYNYYRIKQTDMDGNSTYSDIATEVIKSNETDIVIFPNPTSGDLYVNLTGLPLQQNVVSYIITDLNGKVWSEKEVNVNNHNTRITENMQSLPAGLYFIQMRINGNLSVHKVSKQF